MMMVMAKAKADIDERRRVVTGRHDDWRRNTDWLRIDDDGRGLRVIIDGSRLSDDDRRGSRHVNDLRRSSHVNGSGMQGMTDDVDGGDSGEDFADRGPFTVSGGGGLNTGSNKSGET